MNKEEYIDELRLHGTRELSEEIYKLESNWKALKEWLEEQIPTDKTVCTKRIKLLDILTKMNELEGDK